jgi:two-component system, chemotaxis family, response regulator Rcp1
MRDRAIQILLVEDNPMDVLMIRECLKKWSIKNYLNVVQDGEQALDFLFGRGSFVGSPRPDLMLLDLNLPKTSGDEVLSEIKKHPDLASITVVVVTTFDAVADRQVWNDLGAELCITKPLDAAEYYKAISHIEDFWIATHDSPGDCK